MAIAPVVLLVVLIFSNFFATVEGQYAPDYPSPIPVVIKSPYLNFWLASDANLTTPGGRWPVFYTGPNVSWSGYIRVDGTGYNFQGNNPNYTTARTVGAYITPTRTIFTIDAGSVQLNLTYLSPIELADWKLHSFPFAYMAIDAWSTDSQPHHVQIYSGVSGEFVSSNTTNTITWNTSRTSSGNSFYHQVQRISTESLTENAGMAEDGVLYFATKAATDLTWQSGAFYESQSVFLANGSLSNTSDTKFRSISSDTPVMSFALNLGNITRTAHPIVFTLGLVRDPVLTYLRGEGMHNRTSLWFSQWSSVDKGVDDFLSNYPSALSRAVILDIKIMSDAADLGLSSNTTAAYQNLVALNLRQTMGALEFTSKLVNETLDEANDLRVFMKDVGSSRRVDPVEAIYAAFPAFLYLNSSLAGAVLEPLLEFQSTPSLYSHGYAAPDLGSNWPQVKGNNTDQSVYAVENCGSMLIMALAHARKSGDGGLIYQYYSLLRTWADYLVTNGLHPNGSLASDNIAETSNLAVKAISGIYAMGQINQILEARGADPAKTKHYLDTAISYAKQWEALAFSYDHVTSTYGNAGSWGFVYNLYWPKLLAAGIFSQKIYEAQAAWYATRLAGTYNSGPGFDTNIPNIVKAHWTLLTAGSVYNTSVSIARDALIAKAEIRPYFKNPNPQNKPNPSTYAADLATAISGISSPALGAAFALLALNVPDQTSITLPMGRIVDNDINKLSSSRRNRILGGTVGGVAGVIVLGLIFFFLCCRPRAQRPEQGASDRTSMRSPSLVENSPINATTIVHVNTGGNKALLRMTYNEDGPSVVSPASDSDSHADERTAPSGSNHQGLVPQREAHVNLSPGDETSFPSSRRSRLRRPNPEQDQGLRREVEQLRVEIDALRAGQRLQVSHERPPSYAEL